LPEAFVIGGMRLGEKQEQSKNKIALKRKIPGRDGEGAPSLDHGRRKMGVSLDALWLLAMAILLQRGMR
jgi:hypothetical protein